ncbi:hypothetical protein BpHYR1_045081 [Brachionus plicatilis]|uniref:Uncharacterized protein n=1 Tax=Brachionus plicatilis TaxID=10195 RepID=A0A3M7PPD2_BRAPC|nr:hypothetical protein BpHYR1_045081 [Brachionus plicatilis]
MKLSMLGILTKLTLDMQGAADSNHIASGIASDSLTIFLQMVSLFRVRILSYVLYRRNSASKLTTTLSRSSSYIRSFLLKSFEISSFSSRDKVKN